MLQAAAEHRGTAFVEIFQDCPIFNDGSFDVLRKADTAPERLIPVVHGEPIRFGPANDEGLGTYAVVREGFGLRVAKAIEVDESEIVVHDATDHNLAFALSRLSDQDLAHTVIGRVPQRRAIHLRRRRPRAGPVRAREPLARPAGPAERPRHLERGGLACPPDIGHLAGSAPRRLRCRATQVRPVRELALAPCRRTPGSAHIRHGFPAEDTRRVLEDSAVASGGQRGEGAAWASRSTAEFSSALLALLAVVELLQHVRREEAAAAGVPGVGVELGERGIGGGGRRSALGIRGEGTG